MANKAPVPSDQTQMCQAKVKNDTSHITLGCIAVPPFFAEYALMQVQRQKEKRIKKLSSFVPRWAHHSRAKKSPLSYNREASARAKATNGCHLAT